MLSDPSFDDYLRAGGWRGYAQRAAKDAFVCEARSWLEPLQQMLDAEEARLQALECTTADDFLIVVSIKRQLGALKRYLKISTDDTRRYQTMRIRAFRARQKAKPREFVALVGEFRDRLLARGVAPRWRADVRLSPVDPPGVLRRSLRMSAPSSN